MGVWFSRNVCQRLQASSHDARLHIGYAPNKQDVHTHLCMAAALRLRGLDETEPESDIVWLEWARGCLPVAGVRRVWSRVGVKEAVVICDVSDRLKPVRCACLPSHRDRSPTKAAPRIACTLHAGRNASMHRPTDRHSTQPQRPLHCIPRCNRRHATRQLFPPQAFTRPLQILPTDTHDDTPHPSPSYRPGEMQRRLLLRRPVLLAGSLLRRGMGSGGNGSIAGRRWQQPLLTPRVRTPVLMLQYNLSLIHI